MNESFNQIAVFESPPESAPQTSRPGTGYGVFGRLGQAFPPLVIFTTLGALLAWGHFTGWTLPKFSSLAGGSQANAKEDWCSEHNVPESQCVECNPALMPRPKAPGWCKLHGVHECPLEHPEIAQTHTIPQVSAADLARAKRGWTLPSGPRTTASANCTSAASSSFPKRPSRKRGSKWSQSGRPR